MLLKLSFVRAWRIERLNEGEGTIVRKRFLFFSPPRASHLARAFSSVCFLSVLRDRDRSSAGSNLRRGEGDRRRFSFPSSRDGGTARVMHRHVAICQHFFVSRARYRVEKELPSFDDGFISPTVGTALSARRKEEGGGGRGAEGRVQNLRSGREETRNNTMLHLS